MESKSQFKDSLFNQLNQEQQKSPSMHQNPLRSPLNPPQSNHQHAPTFTPHFNTSSPQTGPSDNNFGQNQALNLPMAFLQQPHDLFTLPLELQGGIGTISSRRPSYAAESFTRATDLDPATISNVTPSAPYSGTTVGTPQMSQNYNSYAAFNNYTFNLDVLNDSLADFNLNSNFNDFQARRPSHLAEFQLQGPQKSPFVPSFLSLQTIHQGQPYSPVSAPVSRPATTQEDTKKDTGAIFLAPNAAQHLKQTQTSSRHHASTSVKGQTQPSGGPNHRSSQSTQQPDNKLLSGQGQGQGQGTQFAPTQDGPQLANIDGQFLRLENGLILHDLVIIASPDLKQMYLKTTKYFQDPGQTKRIVEQLNSLLSSSTIIKLITFIKNLNNLTFNHKRLSLVINKNGKFDLLLCPNNSNLYLQADDLVIVDGDRGKDLVMIVQSLVDLNFAILFNFLKKLEHLKSLSIMDGSNKGKKVTGGTHSTSLKASQIISSHSNEDNEFIITLPTKQVLRFATPKEMHKLSGKFLEEKKAFVTCLNKIRELNLSNDLELINVEYQSDFKKLIFYYFAGFKRIDFRGLIKELFKIYKTRIWLCAVLPFDKPELYIGGANGDLNKSDKPLIQERTPQEYKLTNEQILKFSVEEFQDLSSPNYFQSTNLENLIKYLQKEIKGKFYGFNNDSPVPQSYSSLSGKQGGGGKSGGSSGGHSGTQLHTNPQTKSSGSPSIGSQSGKKEGPSKSYNNIVPNFNPFGDVRPG